LTGLLQRRNLLCDELNRLLNLLKLCGDDLQQLLQLLVLEQLHLLNLLQLIGDELKRLTAWLLPERLSSWLLPVRLSSECAEWLLAAQGQSCEVWLQSHHLSS
jgi:hypothetical protein